MKSLRYWWLAICALLFLAASAGGAYLWKERQALLQQAADALVHRLKDSLTIERLEVSPSGDIRAKGILFSPAGEPDPIKVRVDEANAKITLSELALYQLIDKRLTLNTLSAGTISIDLPRNKASKPLESIALPADLRIKLLDIKEIAIKASPPSEPILIRSIQGELTVDSKGSGQYSTKRLQAEFPACGAPCMLVLDATALEAKAPFVAKGKAAFTYELIKSPLKLEGELSGSLHHLIVQGSGKWRGLAPTHTSHIHLLGNAPHWLQVDYQLAANRAQLTDSRLLPSTSTFFTNSNLKLAGTLNFGVGDAIAAGPLRFEQSAPQAFTKGGIPIAKLTTELGIQKDRLVFKKLSASTRSDEHASLRGDAELFYANLELRAALTSSASSLADIVDIPEPLSRQLNDKRAIASGRLDIVYSPDKNLSTIDVREASLAGLVSSLGSHTLSTNIRLNGENISASNLRLSGANANASGEIQRDAKQTLYKLDFTDLQWEKALKPSFNLSALTEQLDQLLTTLQRKKLQTLSGTLALSSSKAIDSISIDATGSDTRLEFQGAPGSAQTSNLKLTLEGNQLIASGQLDEAFQVRNTSLDVQLTQYPLNASPLVKDIAIQAKIPGLISSNVKSLDLDISTAKATVLDVPAGPLPVALAKPTRLQINNEASQTLLRSDELSLSTPYGPVTASSFAARLQKNSPPEFAGSLVASLQAPPPLAKALSAYLVTEPSNTANRELLEEFLQQAWQVTIEGSSKLAKLRLKPRADTLKSRFFEAASLSNAELVAQYNEAQGKDGQWQGTLSAGLDPKQALRSAGKFVLSFSGQGPLFNLQLQGQLDAASLAPFIDANLKLQGAIDANVSARLSLPANGKARLDQSAGTITMSQLALEHPPSRLSLHEGTAKLELSGDTVNVTQWRMVQGRARNEEISATGTISLDTASAKLALVVNKLTLPLPSDQRIVVTGQGQLTANRQSVNLVAKLKADQARLTLRSDQTLDYSSDVTIHRRAPSAKQSSQGANLPLTAQIELDLGEDFSVTGEGLAGRLMGRLQLASQLDSPAIRATGNVTIKDGKFSRFGQQLTIERGVLRFAGPLDNPGLDIEAKRPNLPVEVSVLVAGSAQSPRVKLQSVQPLTDAEKLSWLVLGAPLGDSIGGQQSGTLAAALAALAADASGSEGNIASALSLSQLGLSKNAQGTNIVTIGKRISDRLLISYEQGMRGVWNLLKIQFQLTKQLELRIEAGTNNAADLLWILPLQ